MNQDDKSSKIFGYLFFLYFLISQIMTVVFFVQYCKTDSLIEIIFIDAILSEFKGLLWIFFIW